MLFFFSKPVLNRHLWQLKTVVFLHRCLIYTDTYVNHDITQKSFITLAADFLETFHSSIHLTSIRYQCYKTFYDRNLRNFVISWSVCTCQAFPAFFNVCWKSQEPTQAKYISIYLLYGKLQPYPRTLDLAWKPYHGQTLHLITKIRKLRL